MKRTLFTLGCLSFSLILSALALAQQKQAVIARQYFTPYGTLTFTVRGLQVTGTYPHKEGRIRGRLEGHELKGSWRQNDGSGSIIITFDDDFSDFKARYNHAATPDKWSDWTGMRKPALEARRYETPWGVLALNFEGSQVVGNYPWFNGRVMGELKGTEFKGIWLQANGGVGTLNLTFTEDFSSFKGQYNDYNYHPDKWAEWNGKIKP
ncbi:MAG TPA: hypothetical protein VID27_17495 [Blastocatellia bacterium]|jgi:alkaline phosphatase D